MTDRISKLESDKLNEITPSHLLEILDQYTKVKNYLRDREIELSEKYTLFLHRNRGNIKKLYPQKGKIYKLVKNELYYDIFHLEQDRLDAEYIRVEDDRLVAEVRGVHHNFSVTVRGVLFNSELKALSPNLNRDVNILCIGEQYTEPTVRYGSVYLLEMEGTNYYKVGVAKDIKSRVSSIQTGNPHKITVIAHRKSDDCYKTERSVHEKFKDYRVNGEWFELEDFTEIKNYLLYKSQ